MFEEQFERFVNEQKRSANTRRREMLEGDLTGTKKMFETALWPVFKTFDGFTLEYEMRGVNGVTMFIDAFLEPLSLACESEGYVAHAEKISRDRFSFERNKIRTMALLGYIYYPFSWDELNKKPAFCQSSLYEFIGRHGASGQVELSAYENNVLRYVMLLPRPFRLEDVCFTLKKGYHVGRKVLKQLLEKNLIRPLYPNKQRYHEYVVVKEAVRHIR